MDTKPTLEEIDYRTRLATCEAMELKVLREKFDLENRRGELCRIDTALDAFDGFLRDFVAFMDSLPDMMQSIVPQTTPVQYARIRTSVDEQIQRLGEHRLYLKIQSNTELQRANTAARKDREARTEKRKKEKNA